MRLEKSLTFIDASRPVWRVTFGMKPNWFPNWLWPIWGPFCRSKYQAIYQWVRAVLGFQVNDKGGY